ncbi:hypothetical protein LK09_18845 [Microbacterium mangrovi]|uniref:DUF559 domain-containing protein n=1 Tax=Microbacterium mangrovi TaxID=1348253 RepID=A0A0B2A0X1_9MICO|nr:hypothetical protein [Microbacterium mangrovi]KHK95457.1 hypothetical protein LK09_18845 [Microbacterium mangrovi]
MSPQREPIAAGLGSVFRVRDALAAGVAKSRLRAADLEAPFWGVRRYPGRAPEEDAAPWEVRDAAARRRALAYVPRMVPGSFLVLMSAAALWGIPVPHRVDAPVQVGVLLPHRAPRGGGVEGHAYAHHLVAIRDLDGVAVSSPASTWAQLGAVLGVHDLVAAGDGIVRVPRLAGGEPGDPASALGTVEQLAAAIEAGRRTGIGRLREALPLIRVGASSRAETLVRLDLVEAGLPEPALDVEVRHGSGRLLGISDLAYPGLRIAVEYEGDQHRTDPRQWERDIEKYRAYERAGWAVVRLTARNVFGIGPRPAALVRAALNRAIR